MKIKNINIKNLNRAKIAPMICNLLVDSMSICIKVVNETKGDLIKY